MRPMPLSGTRNGPVVPLDDDTGRDVMTCLATAPRSVTPNSSTGSVGHVLVPALRGVFHVLFGPPISCFFAKTAMFVVAMPIVSVYSCIAPRGAPLCLHVSFPR